MDECVLLLIFFAMFTMSVLAAWPCGRRRIPVRPWRARSYILAPFKQRSSSRRFLDLARRNLPHYVTTLACQPCQLSEALPHHAISFTMPDCHIRPCVPCETDDNSLSFRQEIRLADNLVGFTKIILTKDFLVFVDKKASGFYLISLMLRYLEQKPVFRILPRILRFNYNFDRLWL